MCAKHSNEECLTLKNKKTILIILSISYFTDGGVEETRTLAPVNPIYFLSREAPSPTWVLLQSERPLY